MDKLILMDCGEYWAIDHGHPFLYIPKSGLKLLFGKEENEECEDF